MLKFLRVGFVAVISLSVLVHAQASKVSGCYPGVTRYSTSKSPRHFYDCSAGEHTRPLLQECPEGKLYSTQKQVCVSKAEAGEKTVLDEKSLGRSFQLGSLYDARSTMVFPEASFWNLDTLNNSKSRFETPEVTTEFSAAKTVKEKMSSMDISASLTLSFLGGLIRVTGKAGYLKETVDIDNEVNVAMTFHTKKYTETMSKYIEKDYPEICSNDVDKYTHVVTSVTYGMDAVFNFKRIVHEHEDRQLVYGNLGIAVNSIPGLSIKGEGDVDLNDETKEVLNSTTLTIYGDFSPDEPLPTSFNESLDFYKRLPLLAGTQENNWKGTTILDVHMTPITWLCNTGDYILNEISNGLMANLNEMLDELEQLSQKVGGLMTKEPSLLFKPLKHNLNTFKVALEVFRLDLNRNLTEILPNVRGGTGHGEEDLLVLLDRYKGSQFEFEKASQFLVKRNREIEAVNIVLANFPQESNIAVADFEKANDVSFIYTRDQVIVLEFNVLTPEDVTTNYLEGNEMDESGFWFNDVSINGQVGEYIRSYGKFSLENVDQDNKGYLINIKLITDDTFQMTAMVNGLAISSNEFIVPVAPAPPAYYDLTHNSMKVKIAKTSEFVTGCVIYIVDVLDNNTMTEQHTDFSADIPAGEEVEVIVDGLESARPYAFMVRLVTRVGIAPISGLSEYVLTRPASPPQSLAATKVDKSSIRVTWSPPAYVVEGVFEDDVEYQITMTGEDGSVRKLATKELTAAFDGLVDATKYSFEATAIVSNIEVGNMTVALETNRDEFSIFTSPLPPKMMKITDTEIGEDSVIINFEPPIRLGTGASLIHYNIEYSAMDQNGTKALAGTSSQIIQTDTIINIVGLAQGQLYEFSCQIITTEGESEFSRASFALTKFNQKDMANLRTEIATTMVIPLVNDAVKNLTKESTTCGYSESVPGSHTGVVTFSNVTINKNDFTGAALINDGVFTAPATGVFKVTYAVGEVDLQSSDGEHIFKLAKNGQDIAASFASAKVAAYESFIPMSGTVLMELARGDEVTLKHEANNNPKDAHYVTLCFGLVQANVLQ